MYAIFTDGTEFSSTLPFTFVAKHVVYGPNIYICMERGGWEVKREAVIAILNFTSELLPGFSYIYA